MLTVSVCQTGNPEKHMRSKYWCKDCQNELFYLQVNFVFVEQIT
jgi:hypothetical protein